jgi:ATP-dependent RNA helicase DeaD
MEKMVEFKKLGLSDKTLAALAKKGFEKPSPIQALTIPALLNGEKDVIGQAQTGTGKTEKIGRHDIVSREETMIRLPEES